MRHRELETHGQKVSWCRHILDFLLQNMRPDEAGQLTQEIGTGYLAFVEATTKSQAVVLKQSGGFSIIIKKKKKEEKNGNDRAESHLTSVSKTP